ncbi:hypothetical protein OHC33_001645 [Knufia fluminis]|uniref:xylan 1,4-beta-xylosidase n=1 Tax=Knufia fluminis TaxID=191047 RepID=A0AAN8EK75_9EURO|nr:hypothetical protein OHC33_001645 [Knufia fluminis]
MVRASVTTQVLLAGAASAALFPDCQNGPLSNNTVCDPTASVTERAQAFVAALTNEEKFNLTGSTSPGVPRLGVPSYIWWNEALHGVASSPGVDFADEGDYSYATSFPQPIVMGAAFDDALINAVATVVSTEARAFNNANRSGLDFWTPNINPYKDPRWGRGQETPGEDTYHLRSYVAALIDGLQGGKNPEYLKVVATCKHFVAYDMENWHGVQRYEFDAQVTPQDLSEYYMQPFQTCARDAGVASIMCSYNALNGLPTCLDPYILQDVLRDHWNWTAPENYVTTDCDSLQSAFGYQHYADTRAQTVADALIAGTELNCGTYYQRHLGEAFTQGLFEQSDIDQAVVKLYSALIRLGYFDSASSVPYRSLGFGDVATPESGALALKAAEEGIVLLKNDGTLPLSLPSGRNTTFAFIGNWANATEEMQGNYAGVAPYLNSPLQAAQKIAGIDTIYGGGGGDPTTDGWDDAYDAAAAADIVIYADGASGDESGDRNTIHWTGGKIDLVSWIAELGKPMIVLSMGDQLDSSPFLSNPNISAIMWGGYPGQDGGTALMNIILGKVAPAGRLPVTQYPGNYINEIGMLDMNLRPNETSGNPGRTYKWYDNATIPFGYGLHYTNFTASFTASGNGSASSYDISELVSSCDNATYSYVDLCPFADAVQVDVSNDGDVASDFVTMLFITGQYGPQPYPLKQLVAYQRLFNVAGGQSQTANLNLTLGSLARYDDMGNAVLYPGEYSLLVDVPTQATYNFTLTGQETVIDHWPQPKNR